MRKLIARLVLVAVFSATTTPAMANAHHARTGADVCALLATMAGPHGPYSVDSAGDVISGGEVMLSCDAAAALVSASDDRDPILCAIFVLVLTYLVIKGVIDVDSAGDIYLLGAKAWDCPPYDQ